jgi:hypothetical protein
MPVILKDHTKKLQSSLKCVLKINWNAGLRQSDKIY